MDFKHNLNLQRLAAITYATSFINRYNIQPRVNHWVRLYLNEHCMRLTDPKPKKTLKSKLEDLMREIIEKLDKTKIPNILLDEIIYVIDKLIERCRKWHENVMRHFDIYHTDHDAFHWTIYGTVDTTKIVEEEWTKWFGASNRLKKKVKENCFYVRIGDHLYNAKKKCGKFFCSSEYSKECRLAMYYMACACTLSTYIKLNSGAMLRFCEGYPKKKNKKIIEFILYSVLFFVDSREKINLRKHQKFLTEDVNAQKMFSLSVQQGCDVAAQFYWRLLNFVEKNQSLIPTALDCFDHYIGIRYKYNVESITSEEYFYYESQCKTRCYADILVFLLQQMSEDQRQNFFFSEKIIDSEHYLASLFVNYWPWEELFFQIFEATKTSLDKNDCHKLLNDIVKKMIYMRHVLDRDPKRTIYFKMFLTVFEEIRKHGSNGEPLLIPNRLLENDFYRLCNVRILKLVAEFECEDEYKKEFLNPARYRNVFHILISKNQLKLIDEFTEGFFISDHEKWMFKKSLNLETTSTLRQYYTYVKNGLWSIVKNYFYNRLSI